MNTIRPTEALVYYDGVEVFEGRDAIGGHYIGLIIDTDGDIDRYLVTGALPERLRQFRSGTLDLRTLLLEAPGDEWYTTLAKSAYGDPLVLEPHNEPLAETDFLPSEGFLLDDATIDDEALLQARERGNVILELRAEPPESAASHRIGMATLGGLLTEFQILLGHAYRKSIGELTEQGRQALDTTDSHLMNVVVPAAPGSFKILLEAAKPPDMLGSSELRRALQQMDKVFEVAKDPSKAIERIQEHKGHLAGSYIRLMKFLSSKSTGMWYSWADPTLAESKHGGVSEGAARELAALLSGVTALSSESVTIIGEFERVNRSAGDWGLLTDDGIQRGKTADGGPSLDGLQVGKTYTFECLDKVDIVYATGGEKHTLYLQSIRDK